MGRLMQTRTDEPSFRRPPRFRKHACDPVPAAGRRRGTGIAPLAGMAAQILIVALFTLFFATLAMSTVTVVKRFADQARGHAPS
jgi:hypothetical protein